MAASCGMIVALVAHDGQHLCKCSVEGPAQDDI